MNALIRNSAAVLGTLAILALAQPALGQTFKGKLDATTKQQNHKIKMEAGKIYQIDMTSADTKALDPFLILNDPLGKKVAFNDDISPDNLNSRIVYSPQMPGEYTIVATSFGGGGSGDYEVKVTPLVKAGKAQVEKGEVTNNSKVFKDKIAYQPYKVKFEAGKLYQIDQVSKDIDAFLIIVKAGTQDIVAADDDSGGDLNARVIFSPPATGDYEVLAGSLKSGLRNNTGAFTLTIQPLAPAAGGANPAPGGARESASGRDNNRPER
jgi:hypothetical protein